MSNADDRTEQYLANLKALSDLPEEPGENELRLVTDIDTMQVLLLIPNAHPIGFTVEQARTLASGLQECATHLESNLDG